MIAPKIFFLFVPLLVLVKAQYNHAEESKSDASPSHMNIRHSSKSIPDNMGDGENRFPSKDTNGVAPLVNYVLESRTNKPEVDIVYPESYTTALPFWRPIFTGRTRSNFDSQSSNYAPTSKTNPAEELQGTVHNIAKSVPQNNITSDEVKRTSHTLGSNNNSNIVHEIQRQIRPSVTTHSRVYDEPKSNPHSAPEHSSAYWSFGDRRNVLSGHGLSEHARKPVLNSNSKPSTINSTPTTGLKTRQQPTKIMTADNENGLNNFTCKQANGYEAVPNKCGYYVECNGNNAYRSKCPRGLYFDATVVFPNFPCAHPSQVTCLGQPVKKHESQHTTLCPHTSGYFPLPVGDCGKYISCEYGIATEMSCPPGLAYNVAMSGCDWPQNVPGCNPKAFEGFTCPEPITDESGKPIDVVSKHRYKNSCMNYIACLNGFPRLLSCGANSAFDSNTERCVNAAIVKNCEKRPSTYIPIN